MVAKWIETLIGPIEQQKQYKQAQARLNALPEPYHGPAKALHRYVLSYGGVTDGDTIVQMFVDLIDLWERAAADDMPISEILGDDPVEFAETFAQAYRGTQWLDKERARLIDAVDTAKRAEQQ